MAWQLIVLKLRADRLPQAEGLLRLAGADAVSLADAGDEPLLEPAPGETPLWREVELRALLNAEIDARALADLLREALALDERPRVDPLADAQWIDAWRQRIAPREFHGFWILPADAASAPARSLRLNMGLAFGTGQHATTALCLEWLATEPLDETLVLDFGCGSGVLALAALELGASRAWAVDNDLQALAATEDNARLNGLREALWIGLPESLPQVAVDVVIANIVAGTLIASAETLAARARPGARIVLSGVLAHQRGGVEAAYARHFEQFDCVDADGWLRLTARRKRG